MKFKLIKTREEKSVDDILNEIESKKVSVEKKTLEHFSKEFQPDILKITSVLVSSENDTHIKVSEKMFELLKRKWDGVLTTSATLTILFEEEERRFRERIGETIKKISIKEKSSDEYFSLIDLNKVGI